MSVGTAVKEVNQLIKGERGRGEFRNYGALERTEARKGVGFCHIGQQHGKLVRIGFLGVLCDLVVSLEGVRTWGASEGPPTYCYAKEDRFKKGIILSEELEDFGIGADIYEDGQGVLSYGLEW